MMTCSAISRWSVTWLDSTCFQELHLGPRWLNLRTWHICHHGSSVFASTSQTCPRHKRGGFLHQMPSERDQQHLSANVYIAISEGRSDHRAWVKQGQPRGVPWENTKRARSTRKKTAPSSLATQSPTGTLKLRTKTGYKNRFQMCASSGLHQPKRQHYLLKKIWNNYSIDQQWQSDTEAGIREDSTAQN